MMSVALVVLLVVGAQAGPATSVATRVVFVCEHGAAKSLIAAAYFNQIAAARGLTERATFRGVAPDDDLSQLAVAGLRADGIPIPAGKPTAITSGDVAQAAYIFAIGCTLPKSAVSSGKAADWTDVPADQGYAAMRDAIVTHVRALLDEIERRKLAPSNSVSQSGRASSGNPRPDVWTLSGFASGVR
jgi:arsenate reductase (thioredoxin)